MTHSEAWRLVAGDLWKVVVYAIPYLGLAMGFGLEDTVLNEPVKFMGFIFGTVGYLYLALHCAGAITP